VICELQSLGKELSGAVYVAKRFQLRRCNHEERRKTATECILSLLGKSSRLVV
jgi:rRNA-processing protein FCF1